MESTAPAGSDWNWMVPEPVHNLIGALDWKRRTVEDVRYSSTADDQGEALHTPHSVHIECGPA